MFRSTLGFATIIKALFIYESKGSVMILFPLVFALHDKVVEPIDLFRIEVNTLSLL